MASIIYKIISASLWDEAVAAGTFTGAGIDHADGYIHLSAADQVRETATKWFTGQQGLQLIAFDDDDFADTIKWEPSRDGALFPHIYGPMDPSLAQAVLDLPLAADGSFIFPSFIP